MVESNHISALDQVADLLTENSSLRTRLAQAEAERDEARKDSERIKHIDLFVDEISFDSRRVFLRNVGDARREIDKDMALAASDYRTTTAALSASEGEKS